MDEPSRNALIATIYDEFEKDPRIDLRHCHIKVALIDDRIVLSGSLPSVECKRIAANIAGKIAAEQFPVEDCTRVTTTLLGDKALADKVAKILSEESVFGDCKIVLCTIGRTEVLRDPGAGTSGTVEAQIRDGVVTLTGNVNSLNHRRLAEVLMWWIPGCQRVDNLIQVSPAQQDSDDLLTDAVRMVLEKDPLVHSTQIRIGTAGAVVELDGQLPSEEEHMLAVRDAWTVPGVWDVNDRIEVGHGLA